MLDGEIEKRYQSQIRKHQRTGAKWQKTKEVPATASGDSPYWDHATASGKASDGDTPETDAANMDNRAFKQAGDLTTLIRNANAEQELVENVRRLLQTAKQILTQQQYNVFVLMAVKTPNLTEREAAKVLSVSQPAIHQLWDKARLKLAQAYKQIERDDR